MQEIGIYGSLPGIGKEQYLNAVLEVVHACEKYNFTGALIQYNHKVPDPWVLTSKILQNSNEFIPLVAIQPYSIPPFTLAKTIASVAHIYNRKVYLNMITGSNPKELLEAGEVINHSERYERLCEYVEIVRKLLTSQEPLSFEGKYYKYQNLRYFELGINKELLPKFFIGGSSQKSDDSNVFKEVIALTNPEPINIFMENYVYNFRREKELGIRIGLIARQTDEEAWAVAKSYFPMNRLAYIRSKFDRNSESSWRRRLAELAEHEIYDQTYWLGSVLSGRSHSPFLVGSYEKVAKYLLKYTQCGVKHIVLASPQEEYEQNAIVINILKKDMNILY